MHILCLRWILTYFLRFYVLIDLLNILIINIVPWVWMCFQKILLIFTYALLDTFQLLTFLIFKIMWWYNVLILLDWHLINKCISSLFLLFSSANCYNMNQFIFLACALPCTLFVIISPLIILCTSLMIFFVNLLFDFF